MANETKHVKFGPAEQKELDAVVRKLAQGRKAAVEAALERRLSYRDEGKVRWQAYARFLLSDHHTVYVDLKTMQGSVSAKPDMHAVAKVEKRQKREAKAKAAAGLKQDYKVATGKAAPKTVKVVKHDPALPTLEAGVSAGSAKFNAKKARKVTVKPVEVAQ